MKRLIPLIVLLALAGIAWFLSSQGGGTPGAVPSRTAQPAPGQSEARGDRGAAEAERALNGAAQVFGDEEEDEEGLVEEDLQPAARVYKTADDALAAVKRAAADYDDIVLEQFVEPGEDCTWCDTFYSSLRDMATAADVTPEQQSYYAEILAISGRLPNIQALVENIKNAPNTDTADRFAEALELTLGKDDTVQYLGEQFNSDNALLRESSVAAVTNQGSRLAAEMLYKHTVERGDPDGYYSVGIGLGEFVPDDEVLPYLHELVLKRDQYSHLALKSLLNNGLPGLRIAFDVLTNSKDPEADRQMLKDAVDHVSFDDETEEFLKTTASTSKQPLVQEFAKRILEDFEAEGDDYDDDEDEV